VFPKLFRARIPRYESIASELGYTVDAGDLGAVSNDADFINLICDALA
jgi:hypothetical protein